jgi:hypothetical protein
LAGRVFMYLTILCEVKDISGVHLTAANRTFDIKKYSNFRTCLAPTWKGACGAA